MTLTLQKHWWDVRQKDRNSMRLIHTLKTQLYNFNGFRRRLYQGMCNRHFFSKSNLKMEERGKIDNSNAHIHDRLLSWLDRGTSVKAWKTESLVLYWYLNCISVFTKSGVKHHKPNQAKKRCIAYSVKLLASLVTG